MGKPKNVRIATNVIWGTLALGLVNLLLIGFPPTTAGTSPILIAAGLVFAYAILGLIVYKMGAGRNWARITYAVLYVLGLPTCFAILLKIAESPQRGIFVLAQTLLQAYALFLLFSEPGSDWYKKEKEETTADH